MIRWRIDFGGENDYSGPMKKPDDHAKQMLKYKICKDCGTRNHPASGQCAGCGARLRRPTDWFSMLALILIVAIVIGLVVYALWFDSTARPRLLPRPAKAGEPISGGVGPSLPDAEPRPQQQNTP